MTLFFLFAFEFRLEYKENYGHQSLALKVSWFYTMYSGACSPAVSPNDRSHSLKPQHPPSGSQPGCASAHSSLRNVLPAYRDTAKHHSRQRQEKQDRVRLNTLPRTRPSLAAVRVRPPSVSDWVRLYRFELRRTRQIRIRVAVLLLAGMSLQEAGRTALTRIAVISQCSMATMPGQECMFPTACK